MRTPAFLQGVTPRPSVPANFGRLHVVEPTAAPTPPPVAPPLPSPPPAPPAGIPVALAELRPPPTPPPPPVPPQPSAPLSLAIERLVMQNERLADLARNDALEIGFLVAERILEQEVTHNPRALASLVRSAMRRLAEARDITVTVSPANHEKLKAGEPGIANVKLEVDPSFGPGDVKVTSELGVVDGRLSTRIAELKKALEGEE